MPTDYELWATQHGLIDVQGVQVLQFQHSMWGSLFLCDYGAEFSGTTDDATIFTATPVAFTVDLPKEQSSTQSDLTIHMDALGGYVISQIRSMTDAQRDEPILVKWLQYLDNAPDAPALDPLEFIVIDVSATRLAVEIQCAVTIFPNVAAGTRYTLDEFPTLGYL